MNYNDDNRFTTETVTTSEKKKAGIGIGAVVAVVLIAIAAFFLFNNKNDNLDTAGQDVRATSNSVVDSTKDVAAEVPQAVKDATTDGDQDTTRPNKDDSTKNLDQK